MVLLIRGAALFTFSPLNLIHSSFLDNYGPGDSGTVTESSLLADTESSPRVARLVNAEKVCREAGGCCLPLAGLYNLHRGRARSSSVMQ